MSGDFETLEINQPKIKYLKLFIKRKYHFINEKNAKQLQKKWC